ncbi:hypothetical protein D3C75_877950 [compost metagenome]
MRTLISATRSSLAFCTRSCASWNRNLWLAASLLRLAIFKRIRSPMRLASIFALASSAPAASFRLSMVRLPLMASAKLACTFGMRIRPPSVASIWSMWSCRALAESITISVRMLSLRDLTSLSSSRRLRRASAAMSSIALNSASMLSVWLRACSLAALSLSSTSLHHFTVFSASAKSWSVLSSVLMLLNTSSACDLKASRLLAVTMPVTSIRRAGS